MKKLQILVPMAGLGSRFARAGFTAPKPLIPVDGQPMFLKALSSLDNIKAEKTYFFVIRQEHVDSQHLDQLIKNALPEARVIIIPEMTRGAAETALAAQDALDPDSGLIILDCDLWFRSTEYDRIVEASLGGQSHIGGGLLTFQANNPRYSYAKVNAQGMVSETAEKRVISDRAITGAYFFAEAGTFIKAADQLLQRPIGDKMPEYYISLLYNILIDEDSQVQAAPVDDFASFGTPEELAAYQDSR